MMKCSVSQYIFKKFFPFFYQVFIFSVFGDDNEEDDDDDEDEESSVTSEEPIEVDAIPAAPPIINANEDDEWEDMDDDD